MHVHKCPESCIPQISSEVSCPVKNCPPVSAPRGLLDELLNKFSYTGLGNPMDFIPWDPSCCIFYTPDSFLPPWYPALKMTAPLFKAAQPVFNRYVQWSSVDDPNKKKWTLT